MKEKLFSLVGFSPSRDSIKTEVLSGFTTFATMSYILALLPAMLVPLAASGYPVGSAFSAVILATIVGTLLMAFLARRPFGQAPGLTLNLFFIETVCLSMGYPWQFGLTAVLIEGLLFTLLCLSSLRNVVFDMLPISVKHGIAVGIGCFVAMIGFKNSGLLGSGTLFNHIETLTSSSSLLFVLGLILVGVFTAMRVRAGLLLTIVIITLLGIPLGVTSLPDSLFSMPASPAPLLFQFSWDSLLLPDLWVCVFIMLFFDVFDSLGTIVGIMANAGSIRKNGRIPNMQRIMLSYAIGTVAGACMGCSTVTTYVESAAGVAEGGRTGLSALVTALCFVVSLLLSPLFLTIPAVATAPVMVMAGFYLFGSIRHINLEEPQESMPAFLTILLMPVTGSISDGIIVGMFTYIVLTFINEWGKRHKHMLGLVVLLGAPVGIQAQDIQLHYDFGRNIYSTEEAGRQKVTVTLERFKADAWGAWFYFVDVDMSRRFTESAYTEISREFNLGRQSPFAAHIEYDGGLSRTGSFQQAALLGAAWNGHSPDFSKTYSLQLMYKRYFKSYEYTSAYHSVQLTGVWSTTFARGKCTFSGFIDFWRGEKANGHGLVVMLTEPQFWYNANKHFSVGTEWELSNHFIYNTANDRSFFWNPTLALKWKL